MSQINVGNAFRRLVVVKRKLAVKAEHHPAPEELEVRLERRQHGQAEGLTQFERLLTNSLMRSGFNG